MCIFFLALLNSLDLEDEHLDYKQKYDTLLQDFEDYKHQIKCKYNTSNVHMMRGIQQRQNLNLTHDKDHDKTQLNLLKVHNSNLEERIRTISNEMLNKERALQEQLEHQQKVSILITNNFEVKNEKLIISLYSVISGRTIETGAYIASKR